MTDGAKIASSAPRTHRSFAFLEPPGIGLARAPESVSAAEILETMRGKLAPPKADDLMVELLRRRDQGCSAAWTALPSSR
jgi:hypothetical protein